MLPNNPPDAASAASPRDSVFDLGDFVLQCGVTLRGAKLAYQIHGALNADRSNLIVYPTPYSAHHSDIEWLIGPGKALDPTHYCIVVADMLGNGTVENSAGVGRVFRRPWLWARAGDRRCRAPYI